MTDEVGVSRGMPRLTTEHAWPTPKKGVVRTHPRLELLAAGGKMGRVTAPSGLSMGRQICRLFST